MEMSWGYANTYDYRPFIPNILVKFFCKGPWSAHNNITYTNTCQKVVLIIKLYISVPLTITTFLLEPLLSS